MKFAQMPACHLWGSPASCDGRYREIGSDQCAAISSELLGWQPNRAPAAGPVGSRVHPLAWAEGHELARPNPDSAPARRSSAAHGKRNQEHVGWHRDDGDPRQLLLGGRQPQPVQPDLGQPGEPSNPAGPLEGASSRPRCLWRGSHGEKRTSAARPGHLRVLPPARGRSRAALQTATIQTVGPWVPWYGGLSRRNRTEPQRPLRRRYPSQATVG